MGVNNLRILSLYKGFHTAPPHREHVENEDTNHSSRGGIVGNSSSFPHFGCELGSCALFQLGMPTGLEINSEQAQAIDALEQILLSQLITSLQRRNHKSTPRMAG